MCGWRGKTCWCASLPVNVSNVTISDQPRACSHGYQGVKPHTGWRLILVFFIESSRKQQFAWCFGVPCFRLPPMRLQSCLGLVNMVRGVKSYAGCFCQRGARRCLQQPHSQRERPLRHHGRRPDHRPHAHRCPRPTIHPLIPQCTCTRVCRRTHALTSNAAAGQSNDRALHRSLWHVHERAEKALCVPCTGQGAIDACKMGVTIATRYAASRPQVPMLAAAPPDLTAAGPGTPSVHVFRCSFNIWLPGSISFLSSSSRKSVLWGTQSTFSDAPLIFGCWEASLTSSSSRKSVLWGTQFNDTRIIEYLTHQRRLFPALAVTYAMHLSTDALKVRRNSVQQSSSLLRGILPSQRCLAPLFIRPAVPLIAWSGLPTLGRRMTLYCEVRVIVI